MKHSFFLALLFLCSCQAIIPHKEINPAHRPGNIDVMALYPGGDSDTLQVSAYLLDELLNKNPELEAISLSKQELETASAMPIDELFETLVSGGRKQALARSLHKTLNADALLFPVAVTVERLNGNINFFNARTNVNVHYELINLLTGERIWTFKKLGHLRKGKQDIAPPLKQVLDALFLKQRGSLPEL